MCAGMNGGKLRRSHLAFGSSNVIPVSAHHSSSVLAPRHCRYFNMHVRRLPRKQSAFNAGRGVNGSGSLSQSSNPAARQPRPSAATSAAVERPLARSRESRVFISAELKNKADTEMKNILPVSTRKSGNLGKDDCSGRGGGSGHKKVQRSDEVKKTDGAVMATLCGKGLKLRNGRSLPDRREIKQERSVTGQQFGASRFDVKRNKCHMKYRSRSLSPAKPLALARPRRTLFTKKSVSGTYIQTKFYIMPKS